MKVSVVWDADKVMIHSVICQVKCVRGAKSLALGSKFPKRKIIATVKIELREHATIEKPHDY